MEQELLKQVRKAYDDLGGKQLDVRFLPMPPVLRSRGGVGTHWKLPAYVKIANPKDKEDTRILSEQQTRGLIMELYLPEGKRHKGEGEEKKLLDQAWEWVDGVGVEQQFGVHRKNWNKLCEEFKQPY